MSANQLTIFLFHLETCCGFVFMLASVIVSIFGYARTRLWGFLALAFSTMAFVAQVVLRYYAFLRSYDLPAALKVATTLSFFLGSFLSLIGFLALAFTARRRRKPSNQPMQPTASPRMASLTD